MECSHKISNRGTRKHQCCKRSQYNFLYLIVYALGSEWQFSAQYEFQERSAVSLELGVFALFLTKDFRPGRRTVQQFLG